MMRKIRFLIIIIFIVTSNVISYAESEEANAVNYLETKAVLSGNDGSSQLSRELTRIEGLVLILRYMGYDEDAKQLENKTPVFSDVPSWAIGYVNLGTDLGIIKGKGDGKFYPNDKLDLNLFLMLLSKVKEVETVINLDNAIEEAKKLNFVDDELLNIMHEDVFYKGDAVNVISRLLHKENNELFQLKYWEKPELIDSKKVLQFQTDIEKIFNDVKKKYNLNDKNIGIYVEDLNDQFTWSYGDELVYEPYSKQMKGKFSTASAIKLPMAMAVLDYMKSKNLKLSDTFVDPLTGKNLKYESVLKPMISNSTNDSFNYLLRFMGRENVNAYMASLGLKNAIINGELGGGDPNWSIERLKRVYGTTTVSKFSPTDYGVLLKYVYNEVEKKNPYMEYLKKIMIENIHQSRIPRGINYKYPVAHKTGTYTEMGRYVDVGIVYLPENPFSLAIILDGQTQHALCEPFMRELSNRILKYFESTRGI